MRSLKEGIEAGSASESEHPHPELIARADQFMTVEVLALREDDSVGHAIGVLVKSKISGAPVLTDTGKLIGVISELDCMKALAASSFYREGAPTERRVGELMSRDLHVIAPDTDIFTIAHLFIQHRIRRLIVVEGGELKGLVSRRDVLRTMRERYC